MFLGVRQTNGSRRHDAKEDQATAQRAKLGIVRHRAVKQSYNRTLDVGCQSSKPSKLKAKLNDQGRTSSKPSKLQAKPTSVSRRQHTHTHTHTHTLAQAQSQVRWRPNLTTKVEEAQSQANSKTSSRQSHTDMRTDRELATHPAIHFTSFMTHTYTHWRWLKDKFAEGQA